MQFRITKRKSLHPLLVVKNAFALFSFNNVGKRKIFRSYKLKMSMKTNSILAVAIIVIMLVSVFAWLSFGTQSKPIIIHPVSDNPTSTPSPTNQANTTNNHAVSPAKPQDVASLFRGIIST